MVQVAHSGAESCNGAGEKLTQAGGTEVKATVSYVSLSSVIKIIHQLYLGLWLWKKNAAFQDIICTLRTCDEFLSIS